MFVRVRSSGDRPVPALRLEDVAAIGSAVSFGPVAIGREYRRPFGQTPGRHGRALCLAKSSPRSQLAAGKNFMEYDLVFVSHDMLFWGARNIDGRSFDTEENRPTNLQIPLVRK